MQSIVHKCALCDQVGREKNPLLSVEWKTEKKVFYVCLACFLKENPTKPTKEQVECLT